MGNLPQVSGDKLIKAFKRDGWVDVSQRGSHRKLVKSLLPLGKLTVIIPNHKVIKKGTLSSILKDAAITVEKLIRLL